MEDVKKLLASIQFYNEKYRMGAPAISDSEYDKLVEELKNIDPHNDWFKHIEPAPVSNSRKAKLPIKMKSLNKVKNLSEIKNWLKSMSIPNNAEIVITPKFDGLSLLYIESTHKAYSRGGAENEGQDCTPHYNTLQQHDYNPMWNCVFGEFVFNRKSWQQNFEGKVSVESGNKYKSPRNTAAGLLNRDTASSLIQHVDFFRYGVDDSSLCNFTSYNNLYETLCDTFNQPKLYKTISAASLNDDTLMSLFKEWSRLYYIDGLVLYINNIALWEVLGRHQTTDNPLYAIAYKHPDFTESFETTVRDIEWNVSKTGYLKPIVNIDTVDTGDCLMENPTGYNAGWISDHQIAPGAKILVTRSGGVIPKILDTLIPASQESNERMWDNLSVCPVCSHPTAWNNSMVELCCTNPYCEGKELAKIQFFYSTLGAENMGDETIAKMFKAGLTSISMILNADSVKLLQIDGFGDTIVSFIINNNKQIMQGVDAATLMQASSCFNGIGKIKAQAILDSMNEDDLELFYNLDWIPQIPRGKISQTWQNFVDGVCDFYKFVQDTRIPIIKPNKTNINHNGMFQNMNICVSGFRDKELEAFIINNGGKMASGVSKNTAYLIVKDKNASSSKISKALLIDIPIFSTEEFKAKFMNL